tara:strand:- start:125 stop:508 length:384 start_codon:yes stop_codon:yes gene_type:complete
MKDAYEILAEYLLKYRNIGAVIDDKDEKILFEILKHGTKLEAREFREVYKLAVDSGLAYTRCLYCGDLIPKRPVGKKGKQKEFCDKDHNRYFWMDEKHLLRKQKARKQLRQKIKNLRQRERRRIKGK